MIIPEQAIEAAQNVIRTANWEYGITDADMAKALTAAAPHMSGVKVSDDVVERVARAWASIDGKSSEFDRAKKDHEFDRTDGSYSGYMAEAKDLIKRSGLFDAEPSSAREHALEEAAQIVEVKLTQAMTGHSVVGRMLHVLDGKLIREIAAAIRALKSQPAPQTGGGDEV